MRFVGDVVAIVAAENEKAAQTALSRIKVEYDCLLYTSTRIGILGYGNLGRGVELAIRQNDDMELAAVYTRRDPASVSIATEGAVSYTHLWRGWPRSRP